MSAVNVSRARSSLARPRRENGSCRPTIPPTFSPSSASRRSTTRSAGASSRRISGRYAGTAGRRAYDLFDGYCQRLVVHGTQLWRAHTAMETLHPQWNGYGYTWRRDLNAIEPEQYVHGSAEGADFLTSPLNLSSFAPATAKTIPRCAGAWRKARISATSRHWRSSSPRARQITSPSSSSTARRRPLARNGDRLFVHDRPQGRLQRRRRDAHRCDPAGALAGDESACRACHRLGTAGDLSRRGRRTARPCRRGRRGSVEKLAPCIWYADIRGFTPISDAAPGPAVIDLLNDVFETLTSALRPRGGQVLKFIGDGMLATFSFEEADRAETCRRALDAAVEAMRKLDAMNAARAAAGGPAAAVDLALHLGEVLYGNVGATDRLDFTVIGPAINEVARIEDLCEPLDRAVLVSAEFAAAADGLRQPPRAARPP